MKSKTPEDNLISWLASKGEEIETVERIDKKKKKFSTVAFSVSTEVL